MYTRIYFGILRVYFTKMCVLLVIFLCMRVMYGRSRRYAKMSSDTSYVGTGMRIMCKKSRLRYLCYVDEYRKKANHLQQPMTL